MPQMTAASGVDSDAPVSIDSIFSDSPSDNASDAGQDEELTETPVEETDTDADSGDDIEETLEQDDEAEEEPAEAASTDRLSELAKKYGLDPKNVRDRKVLDGMIAMEKRLGDKDSHIDNQKSQLDQLRTKLSSGEYLTEYERSLLKPPSQQAQAEQRQQPATQTAGRQDNTQYGDGYDHWRSPTDAMNEEAEAWQNNDIGKAYEVRAAMFNRQFKHLGLPKIQELIQQAIEQRVGPVLNDYHVNEAERADESSREFSLNEMRKDPAFDGVIREMLEPNGEMEINGKVVPANALRRIAAENPEILEITKQGRNHQETARLSWMARYRMAARIYLAEKASKAALPDKAKQAYKAGQQVAKQQADTEKIRQQVNKTSSKGPARKPSADDEFLAEISRSGGTIGTPAAALFQTGNKR